MMSVAEQFTLEQLTPPAVVVHWLSHSDHACVTYQRRRPLPEKMPLTENITMTLSNTLIHTSEFI